MEAIFTYFLKVNGLLITFFLAYYFLLRKETFFNKNRWFLLLGLFASVILPLITFTKIVWVEPSPVIYETVSTDFVPYIIENKVIEYIEENYDTIEKDMNNRNSTSKRKETITDNSKTRKKREELSISATKSIKKEDVEIVVQFN